MEETNTTLLTRFFKSEYQSLKGFVQSKIHDTVDSDAEDIIQDVALRLFSRPEDALPINNIAGFVYSSIKNKIIDVMRTKKEKLYHEHTLEQLWSAYSEHFYGTAEDNYPERMQDKLKQALMELKPDYRNIILAVDFEGYTYREISEETGIPQGTLMSRRHRAISLLLKQLETDKQY